MPMFELIKLSLLRKTGDSWVITAVGGREYNLENTCVGQCSTKTPLEMLVSHTQAPRFVSQLPF